MPNKNTLIIGAIIVISIIAALFWYVNNEKLVKPIKKIVTPVEVLQEEESDYLPDFTINADLNNSPEIDIVSAPAVLDDSDSQVLLAIADFAPKLSAWLIPDEQLRKWVLVIDLIADGKLPKRYRPVDYPMEKFIADKEGDQAFISNTNYSRMEQIINAVVEIPPKTLASYYIQWMPVLEKAYREQGKPYTFHQRFKQAISTVMATDSLEEKTELIRPGVFYQFADKDLEQASDVEKLLWRMGSENTDNIQSFLRELRYEIEAI